MSTVDLLSAPKWIRHSNAASNDDDVTFRSDEANPDAAETAPGVKNDDGAAPRFVELDTAADCWFEMAAGAAPREPLEGSRSVRADTPRVLQCPAGGAVYLRVKSVSGAACKIKVNWGL